jgi:hypothetical protein
MSNWASSPGSGLSSNATENYMNVRTVSCSSVCKFLFISSTRSTQLLSWIIYIFKLFSVFRTTSFNYIWYTYSQIHYPKTVCYALQWYMPQKLAGVAASCALFCDVNTLFLRVGTSSLIRFFFLLHQVINSKNDLHVSKQNGVLCWTPWTQKLYRRILDTHLAKEVNK